MNDNPISDDPFVSALRETDFSDESAIRHTLRRDLLNKDKQPAPRRASALGALVFGAIVLGVVAFMALAPSGGTPIAGSMQSPEDTPTAAQEPTQPPTATAEPEPTDDPGRGNDPVIHVWREGENLEDVLESYRLPPTLIEEVLLLNNLASEADLVPGTELVIPVPPREALGECQQLRPGCLPFYSYRGAPAFGTTAEEADMPMTAVPFEPTPVGGVPHSEMKHCTEYINVVEWVKDRPYAFTTYAEWVRCDNTFPDLPPSLLTIEEASNQFGFAVLDIGFVPEGYKLNWRGGAIYETGGGIVTSIYEVRHNEVWFSISQRTPTESLDNWAERRFPCCWKFIQTEEVTVNGNPGLFIPPNGPGGNNFLVWNQGGFYFEIIATHLSFEEMMALAESLH